MFKSIFWNSLIFKPVHLNTENEEIRTLTITQTNGFSQETVDKIINQNYNKILINSHDVSLREFEGFNYISEFEISESSSNNIPKNLFSGNSKIKKVILPPQITQIDQFAFAYSTLQEINLENVLIIKENAFDSCLQLTTINLDNIQTLEPSAFSRSGLLQLDLKINVPPYLCYNCVNLSSIILRDPAVIYDFAFAFCHKLSSVIIRDQVQVLYIKSNAFCYAGSFEIDLTTGNDTIIYSAFSYSKMRSFSLKCNRLHDEGIFAKCHSLTKVSLEFTQHFGLCFEDCQKLTEISLPSITYVSSKAFRNCVSLKKANLPLVEFFNEYAFFNCKELEEVITNQNNLVLKKYCFYGCSKLKSFPIERIKLIDQGAFCFCSSLTVGNDVVLSGQQSTYSGCNSLIDITVKIVEFNHNLYYNDNTKASVFENCINLKTVTFVRGEKAEIPPFMFKGCTSLTTVNLHETITAISKYAFANTMIKTIDLKNVDTISTKAFMNSKIETMTINRYTTIDNTSFIGCTNLKVIKLTAGANIPNKYIFNDSPYAKIEIVDSAAISDDTLIKFTNDDTTYNIPSSIYKINNFAFKNSKVKKITCDHKIDFEW